MRFFDNAYEGTPSWDTGRPQPAIVRLAERGAIAGDVLDVGCGTGENALYLAAAGFRVVGVDFAEEAVRRARHKAAGQELPVAFEVGDALRLTELGRSFDTALDSGLFHCLQPAERTAYAASLRAVLRPAGSLVLLAWSDRNPFGRGPERISRRDIRQTFSDGWTIESIEPDVLETRLDEGQVAAWLGRLRRTD